MQDFKGRGEPEISGCTAGCAGGVLGAFLGGVLAISTVYACSAMVGGSVAAIDFAVLTTAVLILLGFIGGAYVGAKFAHEPTATASSVPPNVEEAARTHFNPSTSPPGPREDPNERIKQPGESSPDSEEPPEPTP